MPVTGRCCKAMLKEVSLMLELEHENITACLGFTLENHFNIFMELMEGML